MEGFTPEANAKEQSHGYKIEHLPDADIVLNLNYPDQKEREEVLKIIREYDLRGQLFSPQKTGLPGDEGRYYVKRKKFVLPEIEFLTGRSDYDGMNPKVAHDFDRQSRYALTGVMNEITISRQIKNLVAKPEFQKLAESYGFAGIEFIEPIAAMIYKSGAKYLIYKNIQGKGKSIIMDIKLDFLSLKLRKLFMDNGIHPHDLRKDQLMVTKENGKKHLWLIDVEAYTEK